jgi:hypothetical protein|tara:strand:+ start:6219 stop:6401 length:183 start_codon:yes stop_codon:yes gene_type:complete
MAISRAKTGKQVTPKLGSGKRFKKLAKKTSPALAAYIGRKKYGKKKFQQLSAQGRKRKSK